MSEQKQKLLIEKANKRAASSKEKVNQDPHRLSFHIQPPAGLLNDPNGLSYFKGKYHVFYQWNPFETAHGLKYWGHYTSTDLVHWTSEPIALAPSEWYEKNGCYSGSAIESNGKLVLFYTGNVKDDEGNRETYQCMAVSDDGVNFKKKGPVVHLPEGYTAHFRDPKVWRGNGRWYMILGAQTKDEKGAAVLLSSEDLESWTHLGIVAGSGKNGFKDFGYMWECPDLFSLSGKDILLISPQGLKQEGQLYQNLFQAGYFIGRLDYEKTEYKHGDFTELDRGFDFYAPQTLLDDKGRRIMFGWMGMTDENEAFQPNIDYGWVHALTLPRELTLVENKLYQRPVEELKKLRKANVSFSVTVGPGEKKEFEQLNERTEEVLLENISIEGNSFCMDFSGEANLFFDKKEKIFKVERKNVRSGLPESRICALPSLKTLHIFQDTSSIEIFINEGEEVFTLRYFPKSESRKILFSADGTVNFTLQKWAL